MAQALSAVSVGNALVDRVYAKLTPVYDLVFGETLQAGRIAAMSRMPAVPGSRILEVGVGTGLNASLYPRTCHVIGIDLSAAMLDKARTRIENEGLRHVRLVEMDAAHMRFGDGAFDVVYAPYTISVVPDPVQVAREMKRVCRPGGTLVFLSHFRSGNPALRFVERAISPMTVHIGFRCDLDLDGFLRQAELRPMSSEKVNVPALWTLVTCVKD